MQASAVRGGHKQEIRIQFAECDITPFSMDMVFFVTSYETTFFKNCFGLPSQQHVNKYGLLRVL